LIFVVALAFRRRFCIFENAALSRCSKHPEIAVTLPAAICSQVTAHYMLVPQLF
jgi:hypothetical protein